MKLGQSRAIAVSHVGARANDEAEVAGFKSLVDSVPRALMKPTLLRTNVFHKGSKTNLVDVNM